MRVLAIQQQLPVPPLDGGRLRRLQHLEALAVDHELCVIGRCPDKAAGEAFGQAHGDWQIVLVPESDDSTRSLVVPAVRDLVSETTFDCVHVAGFAQWPGDRAFGDARVVLDVEHLDGTVFRRMRAAGDREVSDFELAATDALTAAACRRANLVLACSVTDADQLRTLAPGARVEIVPNGVDVSSFGGLGPPRRGTPPVVTFTGLLAYWPNADACTWFVEAILPQVEARLGRVTCQIVGRVPPESVVALADGERVRLAADVPDIRPWLAASDVIVVPLRVGSGTRLKILEAFAAARPVVSTTIGCEGLDAESGRHLVVADDPEAFASATARVLASPDVADSLVGEAGVFVRARYDIPVVADVLRALYREVSDRGRGLRPTPRSGADA